MWFKNLQIYRLPAPWAITPTELEQYITPQKFQPCGELESIRQGWVAPRGDQLVYTVNRQMFLTLQTERKLLPTSIINRYAKEKASEIEKQQGYAPGRKQLKEIKEQVTDELLPRAFAVRTQTRVWIDPVNGWLVIDAAGSAKAETIIKLLLVSVDKFALQSLRTVHSPLTCMTNWLAADQAPSGFTIDQDTELRATGEGKATVRYVHHSMEADDARRHIADGKQCTRLAMTWADRISFVLTAGLAIKRIDALDVLTENDATCEHDDERFDADAVLMSGELAKMLVDLVHVLGGELDEQADMVQQAATLPAGDDLASDDLYTAAVAIVTQQQRGSISLIQRHLRIGYNRAARLMEQMERGGVVGAMQSNGNRSVLAVA